MRRTAARQAAENRFADQKMADVEFDDFGQARDRLYGVVGQAVAGMDFKARRAAARAAVRMTLDLARDAGCIVFKRQIAIAAGVQLDDIGADSGGRLDGL